MTCVEKDVRLCLHHIMHTTVVVAPIVVMMRGYVLLYLFVLLGALSSAAEEQCASDGSCPNKPLKIVVIGASAGTTGGLFVKKALGAGHSVTAIARTPSKIEEEHDNLTVVQGDVKKPETLVEPLKGCDVVIGAFGHRAFSDTFRATTLYSDGAKAVLDAMKQAGVKRLLMLSSSGTAHTPGSPFVWDYLFRVRVRACFLVVTFGLATYHD